MSHYRKQVQKKLKGKKKSVLKIKTKKTKKERNARYRKNIVFLGVGL